MRVVERVFGAASCGLLWVVFALLAVVPDAGRAQQGLPAAGGSPADIEKSAFGSLLQPDKLPAEGISGIQRFMLVTITALYNISSQYVQVLRLCKVQAATARTDEERQGAERCELAALLNLERYAEAEALFSSMGESPEANPKAPPLEAIGRWRVVASLAANRGESSLQQAASQRVLDIVDAARRTPEAWEAESSSPELKASMRSMLDSALLDAELDALWVLVRGAYHRQAADTHAALLSRLLATHRQRGVDNAAGAYSMSSAVALVDLGMRDQAVAFATTYLPMLRADAGFRDVPEPIERFVPHPAAVASLGDERTQPSFVRGWVRLAQAYALVGRDAEADRLLKESLTLAQRYVIEPPDSSRLVALVEQTTAQILLWRAQPEAAIPLLRSARQRLRNAAVADRSTIVGRRQPEIDGALLDVGARLIAAIGAIEKQPIRDSAVAAEILSIASDFSASRADSSARQAARAVSAPSRAIQDLLVREGELVDELMDLRGALAAAIVAKRQADTEAATTKMAATLEALRTTKAQMEASSADAPVSPQEICPCPAMPRLAAGQSIRQWILHPAANLALRVKDGGLWISRLAHGLSDIVPRSEAIQASASLREVSRVSDLRPFPMQDAAWLFATLFPDAELPKQAGDEQHWILVPPSVLDRLPWAALVTGDGNLRSEGSRFLVERVAVSVVPSIEAFEALGQRRPSRARMDLLAIGDPVPASLPIGASQLSRRGAMFAALGASEPHVTTQRSTAFAREIEAVSLMYDQRRRTVLKGKDATKQAVLRLPLADYRVILFSTHGHLAGTVSRSIGPSLELSSARPEHRFLGASEISRLSLDTELVVLSACDTSASDGHLDAEGFSGLTSAFLLAGARNVVASLWPIETVSAMKLTTRMMRSVRQEPSRAVAWAVRDAMLDVIRSSSPVARHPGFWAAYVVVGR